jgi:uncharacterized protein with von Willebrand factor type A (vWA) domain
MYPFRTLPQNLVAFCDLLRRDHRFAIGPREVRDATRALELLGVTEERVVRDALRPVLAHSRDEAAVFDRAFSAFFYPGPSGAAQPAVVVGDLADPAGPAVRSEQDSSASDASPPDPCKNPDAAARSPDVDDLDAPLGGPERDTLSPAMRLSRASYSPRESDADAPFTELGEVDQPWRDAARLFVRRTQLGQSRRWRPAAKGSRFDVRRTMRASLHTGGEPIVVRWLRRPKRAPRFVVLVDGSRSMAAAATTALQMATAIACATMRVEAFTFSTRLERVSEYVRRAAAGERIRLRHRRNAWAGGTMIGAALRDFLTRFGDRLLGRDTVIVIVSDGLDVGEPGQLRDAMRELQRRSSGVVWLNPLLETPGYEPTARGMLAARPFVATFAAVNDAAALARLARSVRVRNR